MFTGQLDADGPPVGLQGIEKVDVEGDGEDTLTVAGSDAADTITQQANTVTVGRTTDVAFSGFPTLALAGGPAGDQLWVAPATTVGVTGITGGGAEADSLTVLGTVLSETITHTPHASDGGVVEVGTAPPVTFDAIEATNVHGATAPPSGDTLVVDTPDHDGSLRLEPGAAFDGGTVRFLDVDGVSTTASPVHSMHSAGARSSSLATLPCRTTGSSSPASPTTTSWYWRPAVVPAARKPS